LETYLQGTPDDETQDNFRQQTTTLCSEPLSAGLFGEALQTRTVQSKMLEHGSLPFDLLLQEKSQAKAYRHVLDLKMSRLQLFDCSVLPQAWFPKQQEHFYTLKMMDHNTCSRR